MAALGVAVFAVPINRSQMRIDRRGRILAAGRGKGSRLPAEERARTGGGGTMATRDLTLIGLFAALTAVCAQVSVAVPPFFSSVPFTLQVFAVLASGAVLGSRRGTLSQVVYLLLGAAGGPVFARFHGGAQVLVGPTAGYLWAFPIAAYLAGRGGEVWGERSAPSAPGTWLGLGAGLVCIYAFGAAGLVATRTVPSLGRALSVGVYPFLPADLVKAILAHWVAQRVRFAVPAPQVAVRGR
jgi:biotin transport system substrate-specific component